MKTPDILTLDSRRSVFTFVTDHPGTHLREIARALSLPLGTALYHLDYLERHGLVVVRRDGRYKRYFVTNAFGRVEKDHLSAFRHEVPRRIGESLLADPGLTQRDLCERIGVSRSTLSFHATDLERKGILACVATYPEKRYELAERDLAERLLASLSAKAGPEPRATATKEDELATTNAHAAIVAA